MQSIAGTPDELIDRLLNISELVHIRKGGEFVREGEIPRNMGFNLNGVFRLYYIDQQGNEFTKGFSVRGNYVISYSALVQKRPSFFYIEALEDTDILRFQYDQWMHLANQDIRWYPLLYKLVESVYIKKEMREKAFLLDDATTRYLEFRTLFPGLEDRIKLYHIASFLGITPEALSRIRKKLKSETTRSAPDQEKINE